MTLVPDPAATAAAHDERLAAVLNDLVDRLAAGESIDPESLFRRTPDLADELRSLWGAVVLAGGLAERAPPRDDAPAVRSAAPVDHGPPPLGTLGDYDLLAELGRGGMGVVYQARHRRLDRIVALKTMRRGAALTPTEMVRFRHEAAAAARLDHPHIVRVYEVGEQDGDPYFTMQYVAGTTLAQRLADGPLPPREIAELLLPVCEAVDAAHRQGVLHRDLKPSNILIDRQGRPLVSDFGLAKRIEADNTLTLSGAIVGTPTHMAPEQALGSRGHVGPRSDVYSLGAVLYQMLTGRPPLQGSTPMETLMLVIEQDPPPPRVVNPRADRLLEMIALKCLQKPPDLRYESAGALADDLRAYLANEPIAAHSGRLTQVMAGWLAETHHAPVLRNWGLLWVWHSLALLATCVLTNVMQWIGLTSPWPYVGLWVAGLGTWAGIFWALRHRAGPVTFVERQIAHIWAGSIVSIALLFPVEQLLGLPVLSLSPVLGLISGSVFLSKAGVLSGEFYLQALALYATAPAMALMQRHEVPLSISLFGLISSACFAVPGWRYYRAYAGDRTANDD